MYNFYLRYNYKNIIPFNLKKNKLRIHSSLLTTTKLKNSSIGHKVKFWYHYFGVNNLKRNNTLLVKKFLNKKLSVFFISNFNMVEGKWAFPKVYLNSYKQYLYKRTKKYNLLKKNILYDNNKYNLNKIYFFIKKINFNINFFNINFFFKLVNILKFNFNFFNFFFFKFNINYNLPILFIKTLKKKRNLKINNKFFYKNIYKGVYNSWGFLTKYKKKNDLKKILNHMYLFYLKKVNMNFLIEFKNSKILNKKFKILTPNKYLFDKKIIIKFNVLKKILNLIQFIKIYKELNKYFYKNICFWFYKNYITFKFKKIFKKIKKKKKIKKNIYIYLKNKKITKLNNFKILTNLKKISVKKFNFNSIFLQKKKKNILFWIKKLFIRLYKKNFNFSNLFYIWNLKNNLQEIYNNKIINLSYIYNYILLNKYNMHYIFLGNIWWKYSYYSKVRRLKLLKNKKSKKLKRWFKSKYWIKQNNKTLLLYKTYYRFVFNNDSKKKILFFLKKLWNYNIFNYDYLWLRKHSKFKLNYLNSLNKYNKWLTIYNNNLFFKNLNRINTNINTNSNIKKNIKKNNKKNYLNKNKFLNKRFYSNNSFYKKNNNISFFNTIYDNIETYSNLQNIFNLKKEKYFIKISYNLLMIKKKIKKKKNKNNNIIKNNKEILIKILKNNLFIKNRNYKFLNKYILNIKKLNIYLFNKEKKINIIWNNIKKKTENKIKKKYINFFDWKFMLNWKKKLFNIKNIKEKEIYIKSNLYNNTQENLYIYFNKKKKKLFWEYYQQRDLENLINIKKILFIITMIRTQHKIMQNWLIKRLNIWNFLKLKNELLNVIKIKNKIKKLIDKKYYLFDNIILYYYKEKKWKQRIKYLKFILNIKRKHIYKIKHFLLNWNRFNFMYSQYVLKWSMWLRVFKYNKYKYRNKRQGIKRKKLKFYPKSIYLF